MCLLLFEFTAFLEHFMLLEYVYDRLSFGLILEVIALVKQKSR